MTGASGFVARHLIPLLLEQGHEVRGLARHSPEHTGTDGTPPGFAFIPGDVRLRHDVERLIDGCQAVIHLAASFDPQDNAADINERGTGTLLDGLQAMHGAKLVFLSCLGAEAASPSAFYRSKWRAEQMVRASGLPYTILLPSLVVGNGDGLIRPLAEVIRTLPVVPLPTNGSARQQPIDIADLCRCINTVLDSDRYEGQAISVGGPLFLTLEELVGLIAAQIGREIPRLSLPNVVSRGVVGLLPEAARRLFSEPRRAQFEHGVVASPGIVKRMFEFEPANVALGLASYLR